MFPGVIGLSEHLFVGKSEEYFTYTMHFDLLVNFGVDTKSVSSVLV